MEATGDCIEGLQNFVEPKYVLMCSVSMLAPCFTTGSFVTLFQMQCGCNVDRLCISACRTKCEGSVI
jgi:hypothetical protein